jgi:sec-independent protein translocase protein TatA
MMAFSASNLVLFMGLGVQELLLIFLAIVFLFGAKKIPEIARGLGKGMSEFKKGMHEPVNSDAKNEKDKRNTPADGEAKPPQNGN